MNKAIYPFIILVCSTFFSCPSKSTSDLYYKSFFLGEKSFSMEGESFTDDRIDTYSSNHVPFSFDSVIVRLDSGLNAHHGWEISGTKLAENKFSIAIDIMANEITIGKETITENIFRPSRFPPDFPVYELKFYFNDDYSRSKTPCFKDIVNNSRYLLDSSYIYVAEPVNLSGTETVDNGDWTTTIKHYDYNFSKSGWYRIIQFFNDFRDVPKNFLETNNYFYFVKY